LLLPPAPETDRGRHISGGRLLIARILVVLATLLAVVAALAGYLRWQALDEDTFADTTEELIANDDIRGQIGDTVVEELFANVDVTAALEQRLPEDQQALAAPLAGGLREFADRTVQRLLDRPRGQELLKDALVTSHQQLLAVLNDESTTLTTEEGAVILNLQPLVIQVGERVAIVGRLAERLPEDTGRIEIMEADQLETAQDATQLFDTIGTWIWLLPVALAVAAIWVARGARRRTLRALAIGGILVGLLLLVLRRIGGSIVVEELATSTTIEEAAEDAWEILTALLADGAWTLIGFGLVALVGVWLAGPTSSAATARGWVAPVLARTDIAVAVAVGLMLLLVLWGPTAQTRRPAQVLALGIAFVIGVLALRRLTVREFPEAAPGDLRGRAELAWARMRGAGGVDGRADELERLAQLRDRGVLTDAEFAAEKARLLGTLGTSGDQPRVRGA
jgi:putative oligomerization/nucleic acid binding protein